MPTKWDRLTVPSRHFIPPTCAVRHIWPSDRALQPQGEVQKILDHPGVIGNRPIGVLAHLGLGRAYALSGDTTRAKAAHQDFLSLWNHADPDSPILKDAKVECAKLQ